MTEFPNDGLCHETSGFLFSHRCDRFSVQNCVRCQKPLCQEHGSPVDDGIACTSCVKREMAAEQRNPQRDPQRDPVGTSRRPYYDDPYYYGPHWYPGYSVFPRHRTYRDSTSGDSTPGESPAPLSVTGGDFDVPESPNDPHDFTEGDAESLRNEEDGSFETEMGES
jgi:hypothetical protein